MTSNAGLWHFKMRVPDNGSADKGGVRPAVLGRERKGRLGTKIVSYQIPTDLDKYLVMKPNMQDTV